MSSLCVLLLLTCGGLQVTKAQKRVSPPHTEIIEFVSEFDEYTNASREIILYLQKQPNSVVTIGEDTTLGSRLLLKCSAQYPVQWIYRGDNKPEFTTYTNVEWMQNQESPLRFSAEASLGLLGFKKILREDDSGNYTCASIQDDSVGSSYYIYVPGSSLFASKGGGNITYTYKDTSVRIPCSLSTPNASVTLCKFVHGTLECPVNDLSYEFETAKGFFLNVWNQQNVGGTYVCAAHFKNIHSIAEYTLSFSSPSSQKNPCYPISPCGIGAECNVVGGVATCYCERGFTGNPYTQCKDKPVKDGQQCFTKYDCLTSESCNSGKCVDPDPCGNCGNGGLCETVNKKFRCRCKKGYEGKPPFCQKACDNHSDCDPEEICARNVCKDPCSDTCGINALCRIAGRGGKRNTICECPKGSTGDPLKRCSFTSPTTKPKPTKRPSLPSSYEDECEIDIDCIIGEKCVNNVCQRDTDDSLEDCGGSCGINAECTSPKKFGSPPTCKCKRGYIGDPDSFCSPDDDEDPGKPQKKPCPPNFCPGFGSECKVVNGKGVCKCSIGFEGKAPNCKKIPHDVECDTELDCPLDEKCVNDRCVDACDGFCGVLAECVKTNNFTDEYACQCPKGLSGDPHDICRITDSTKSPCDPSPCAKFAACRVINGNAACKCPKGYSGDPYTSCTSGRGSNPFPSFPSSTQPPSRERPRYTATPRYIASRTNECELDDEPNAFGFSFGSSCDQNTKCEFVNGANKCVSKQSTSGSTNSYSRCVDDEDCYEDETCEKFQCTKVCRRDSCGSNAECRNVDDNPLCSCPRGYSGDPRYRCYPSSKSPSGTLNRDLCDLSGVVCPGRYTAAKCVGGVPLCVCDQNAGYVGPPNNCRLECSKDSHCHKNKACIRNRCLDPCEEEGNSCVVNADCRALNHVAACTCKAGYTGVAWIRCERISDSEGKSYPCSSYGYTSPRCRYTYR